MTTNKRVRIRRLAGPHWAAIALLGALLIASATAVSAHIVRGILSPTLATAFVSSPSAGQDAPIKVTWGTHDTGLRVACFYVANTSDPRPDEPEWPRVTLVGLELPGSLAGFSLIEPLTGEWDLEEGRTILIPGHGAVTLDFAIVARVNPAGWYPKGPHELRGVPPGEDAVRGSGTRFCVSGPFPDTLPNPSVPGELLATTIELILNGVVIGFHRVQPPGPSGDVGVWDNFQRVIPLYSDVP